MISDFTAAPIIASNAAIRYPALQSFWKAVHTLLNVRQPPEQTIGKILETAGFALGADRIYTFMVTADRAHTSCNHEWTRTPELALKPFLQNIDQKGLQGWLDRFNSSKSIYIEDTDNPPDDLRMPAAKFKRDLIKSIYVFGFYDDERLVGYLGIDYVQKAFTLDDFAKEVLFQLASTLNLYILRHESLELWNRTISEMPAAVFIKDVGNDLRYCYANPRYLKVFGHDILGMTDIEAFGAERGEIFRREDRECITTNAPFISDGTQFGRDAGQLDGFYSIVKFPVTTKTGRNYVAGFITDISSEHKLRLQSQELLTKSQAAEKAKSLFLAAMSHEIRTPLNAIIGLVDELRHTDIPEASRHEYLTSVSSASRALLALINDVLDVSKIEAGQMHMTPVETDLLIILAECESIFSESCHGKGLYYKCEVSPDIPIVMIDTSRLRQILFNLIGNAVKFTRTGGIYVYGAFTRESGNTGTLTLEVTDTGIGIAKDEQEKVFGMFEQSVRTRGTAAANMGTGLGLCLCKKLALCMNGEIELKSEINQGSTFRVVLHNQKFVEREKASDIVKHRKDQTIRIHPLSLTTCVLIVDDVPMNLKVLGIILKRMNIPSIAASSAKQALAILEKPDHGITHVLTDIWMPEMNGEALARAIRANPALAQLKLAAQTADVEASDTFDTSLFNAVLSKPLTPEKVSAFLNG